MIVGVGADLSDIRRIQASLDRFGERFKQRCFTDLERTRSDRKPDPAWSYAKRFAAKEACAKALGTGMTRGVGWTEIGIERELSGRPRLELTGRAAATAARLGLTGADVSLSHTRDYAIAHVVLYAAASERGTTAAPAPPCGPSRWGAPVPDAPAATTTS